MQILVAGGTGFLGSRLTDELRDRGHSVTVLTRGEPGPQQARWDPASGQLDQQLVDHADVVVNLSGSPLLGIPRTQRWKDRMTASRVPPTRLLAEAIARAPRPPAFVAGNGSAWYGDHGAAVITEESTSEGDAFMTLLAREWQAATEPAAAAGARVVVLRTAPVMARGGEALGLLAPMFKLALGARLGDGSQYFPVISLHDWAHGVIRLVEHDAVVGPVNLCCPRTPTNAEFTDSFASLVGRPSFLAVPSPLLRLGAGPAAPELLRSQNMRPAVLEDLGHEFRDPDVTSVLASALD